MESEYCTFLFILSQVLAEVFVYIIFFVFVLHILESLLKLQV